MSEGAGDERLDADYVALEAPDRYLFGEGMDYKGFNIAVHEMGHNVEQTISLNDIDHYMLQGVPNTAFTEALAFVFQARDLELLGLDSPSEDELAMRALDEEQGTTSWAAKIEVAEGRKFSGFENSQRVIDSGVDVVLLAALTGLPGRPVTVDDP